MKKRIPQIIQDVNVYIDGKGYLGVTKTLKLPAIQQEMIESKGSVGAKYATGVIKPMEMSFKLSVLDKNTFLGFGLSTFQCSVPLLFKASVFSNGESLPITAAVTGDWESIEINEFEGSKEMEIEVKLAVHFYDLNLDGTTMILVDSLNKICKIGEIDYLAQSRKNLQA